MTRKTPSRPRLVLLVLLGLVLAVAVWTGVALLQARSDLQDARRALEGLRPGDGSVPSLAQTREVVDGAADDLGSARDRLDGAAPRLVGHVPLLGRWVNGPRAVADAGLAVVDATGGVLDAVGDEDLLVDGSLQLPRVRQVQAALAEAGERTRGPVRDLRATRTGLTPGGLADGVAEALELLGPVPEALRRGADALAALDGVLGGSGERRVMVVLANNAEQRGGGGVVTVYAQGVARDGQLRLGPFRDVFDVADPPSRARRVQAPADFRALYGPFLADTTIWRNATMSPDLPTDLAVLSRLSRVSTGVATDVVISLDVRAIAAVLGATGPAQLPDGSPLTAENAVQELLVDAYAAFPDDVRGQTQRRAVLRGAADAVVERLLAGAGDPVLLGRALASAAQGRHLALWSARPTEQDLLVSGGLAGQVAAAGGDIVQVATQNFGQAETEGNKLDVFVRRRHAVSVVLSGDRARVTQDFVLDNTAPSSGLPGYVLGRTRPGELRTMLDLALPEGATRPSLLRDGAQVVLQPLRQGDHWTVRDVGSVPSGAQATWRLSYEVPLQDGRYELAVIPQALSTDATLDLDLTPLEGWRLAADADQGLTRAGKRLRFAGPLTGTRTISVAVEQASLPRRALNGIKDFWTEPVDLPG